MVGRDTPEPNACGDYVRFASAGDGRRSKNPPALAVGSVKARYGQNISEYWPLEIIEPCIATDNSGSSANPVKIGDVLFFSTWACPTISYWVNNSSPDAGGRSCPICKMDADRA